MISISFEKYTLPNGLEVILHEDHSLPMAAVNVWYHVGSKDEEQGKTGFAHLFEHVMFEGSKHHNKSYFEPLQKVGAALNGSTTPDRTNYWENLPSNYLELALWLEADRMGFLLDALDQQRFDIQRDVVKNERRQSYENRPYGMAHMLLQPAVFPSPHPYSWTTIGSPEDLDNASLEDVKAFFQKFYAPSNASLAIVGDIDADAVKRMVERYFGDLPPGPSVNRLGRMDSSLRGQVSLTMRDSVQLPRLYLVWPSGPAFLGEQAQLDILSVILGDGKSARLYKKLVYEKQIVRDLGIVHYAQEIAGEFHMQLTANPGHSLDEIEAEVHEEIERLRREPPTEEELARAKNRIQAHHVRQLERFGGFGGRADQLNYYNVHTGDPGAVNTDLDRYLAVTAEDIQKAAVKGLTDSFVRLRVLPQQSLAASPNSALDRSAMPQAAAEAELALPVVRRSRLANGLNIAFIEKGGIPMAAFGLVVRAGGVNDPQDRPGLAYMTATMLQEGTAKRTSQQIADQMEFMGAQLSIDANREYVSIATDVLTSQVDDALEIVSDVARNATFPDNELERVRKERLTELSRISDNPNTIAMRASRTLLHGPGTAYGHPLTGDEKSVGEMARDELLGFFERSYGPENATFMVVGDMAFEDVIAKAERFFGDWQQMGRAAASMPEEEEAPSIPQTTIYLADKPGAAQSVVRAGHLTIPRHHPDFQKLSLLNYLFGGNFSARLNMNLRQDKGYSYGYNSWIDWFIGPSTLTAGGSVQTAVTKESVYETIREFQDIREARPVTEDEFSDARDGMLRGLPAHFETQNQLLQQLTRMIVFNLSDDYFREYVDALKSITLDDVRGVSKERLDDAHLKILVVGDRKAIETGLRELGYPVVLVDYEGRELEG